MTAFPTHEGLACLAVGGLIKRFHEFRKDIEGNFLRVVEQAPGLGEAVKQGKREERFKGTADQPNFFRRPYGPGWALVGDAGYHLDFITAVGISDAFKDAELLSEAIDDGLSGRRQMEEALAGYERRRNEFAKPLYDATTHIASAEGGAAEFAKFAIALARTMPA